jgi:hypothetical protein
MEAAVESCFGTLNQKACTELAELMLRAEDAYFENVPHKDSGEFDFEPLQAVNPKELLYLEGKPEEALIKYMKELQKIQKDFESLKSVAEDKSKLHMTIASVRNVISDIKSVLYTRSEHYDGN